MDRNDGELPEELQRQLDEVEEAAEAEEKSLPRFDVGKGAMTGAICFGLFLTFAVAMRATVWNALLFGIIGGGIAFVTAGCQKPKRRR